MTEDIILSKLAVTRMSHDLAGVIGAVSNSLELLAEFDETDKESLSLAQSGAECLVARLSFFRQAYGADGSLTGADMTHRVLVSYLHSLENKSLHYELVFDVDAEVPLFVLRLALLTAQICSDAMTHGGQIKIRAKAGEKMLSVEGTGEKLMLEKTVEDILNGIDASITSPRHAGAKMLQITVRDNHWQYSFEKTQDALLMRFFA